jgi:hypothetical protein
MLGLDGLSTVSQVTLLVLTGLLALIFVLLLWWQVQVMKGKTMENPDGSVDDWHEQEILYGMAVADVFVACPLAFVGVVVTFLDPGYGILILAMASFFQLWVNVATTVTSVRFRQPKMSVNWFFIFPFGSILGGAYLVWVLVHIDVAIV